MPKGIKLFQLRSIVQLRRRHLLVGGGAIGAVVFGVLIVQYFLPAHIAFSYAQPTSCTQRLTFLPGLFSQQDSDDFAITLGGGIPYVLSTEICASPTKQPDNRQYTTSLAPFDWGFLRSVITISPTDPPTIAKTERTKLPITEPLQIQLSSPDVLHRYLLRIAKQATECTGNEVLVCELTPLKLAQGKTYGFSLERQFGDDAPKQIDTGSISILDAVTAKDASVKNGTTVYDTPRTFTIRTNKTLASAEASLTYEQDSSTISVDTTTKIDGSAVIVTATKDLPREVQFSLTVSSAVAADGSLLAKPYTTKFTTSGAPKVVSTSLGSSGALPGTTVTIQFDQPITAKSASKSVSINGSIIASGVSGSTLSFTLPNLNRCAAFTVTVAKGIVGAKNELASRSSWSTTSRIACGTSRTIGYSVKNRPIVAYYFGTPGGTTTLFTGGIHGEEQSGAQTMAAWVSYLEANGHRIPSGKQIVVIPRQNPDGLANYTRLNANGVNLARNYPTSDWIADIDSSDGIIEGGGGSSPGSEPETKAAMNAVTALRVRLAISYHAQGSLVGSNNYGSADRYASRYASYVGYGNMSYNPEATLGYSITAELETWLAERGVPAILIELPTRNGNYLPWHQDIMWNIATE